MTNDSNNNYFSYNSKQYFKSSEWSLYVLYRLVSYTLIWWRRLLRKYFHKSEQHTLVKALGAQRTSHEASSRETAPAATPRTLGHSPSYLLAQLLPRLASAQCQTLNSKNTVFSFFMGEGLHQSNTPQEKATAIQTWLTSSPGSNHRQQTRLPGTNSLFL